MHGCSWKMSKDIGMGVRKGTVVSFVPTLFSCFLGIHPYMSFHFFLGGGGGGGGDIKAIDS